jgi:hypothetical protein
VTTDDYKPVQSLKQTFTLATGCQTSKTFTLKAKPGFYRYTVYLQSGGEKGKPVKAERGLRAGKDPGLPGQASRFLLFLAKQPKSHGGCEPRFPDGGKTRAVNCRLRHI